MVKKPVVILCAIPLLTLSSAAFSANGISIENAATLIKSGDVKYIASIVLSKLPYSVLEAGPKSFVTYNALRMKNNHGIGGGVGGGRGHKC